MALAYRSNLHPRRAWLVVAPLVAMVLYFALFTGPEHSPERTPDNAIALATRAGAKAAIPLAADLKPSPLEIEAILIDVRSRQGALRRGGHPQAAAAYIAAFRRQLRSVNPALADSLPKNILR